MPTALNRRILAALPLALRVLPTRFTTLLFCYRRQCSGRCWRWQAPHPRWRRRFSSAPAAAPALLSFTTSFTTSFNYSALLVALLQVLFCSSCSSPNVCLDKVLISLALPVRRYAVYSLCLYKSTKVQTLTAAARQTCALTREHSCAERASAQVLSLLALLVQKYTY